MTRPGIQTADMISRSRGAFRPSFASSLRPHIQEGAGKAGCRLAPAVRCAKSTRRKTAQQHTGVANHSAFPARRLDGLCRALPGAEFSLASLASRIWMMLSARLGSHTPPRKLDVATTARTTRFCRTHGPPFRRSFSSPVDEAENLQARRSLAAPLVRTRLRAHRVYPPCPHHLVPTLPRPSQARLAIKTTTRSPLKDERHIRRFRISVKWNIFAERD
ncbi:hypothetical protein ACVWWI_001713 [Bradyrhizobium sp. USDA 3686]|nr:hypothetical protein [Bradyrhizobium canariense]